MGEIDRPKMTMPDEPVRRLSWWRVAVVVIVAVALALGGLALKVLAWLIAILIFVLVAGWLALLAARWLFPRRP